jgi:predicted nucleic acid-binding protein
MVLVDTSVWIAHLRSGDPRLASLLDQGEVVCHPAVIGELACGNLPRREETLRLFNDLPQAVVAGHDEVMRFIESEGLMGTGLGYVDVHLLASARLTGAPVWTLDQPLRKAARKLAVFFP